MLLFGGPTMRIRPQLYFSYPAKGCKQTDEQISRSVRIIIRLCRGLLTEIRAVLISLYHVCVILTQSF